MKSTRLLATFLLPALLAACGDAGAGTAAEATSTTATPAAGAAAEKGSTMSERAAATGKVVKTEEEWKRELTPQEFQVLRQKGTERAFTGEYHDHHEKGVYVCAACGQELFSSETKFESGTGWPSFYAPVAEVNVETETDKSYFMTRTEVHCSRCGGHLGHIFDDGPRPTGLRYCINSVSLDFAPRP